MAIFDTHIDGIECRCKVTHYQPYVPAKVNGPAEDCYPAEASEFEYRLFDRCDNPAPQSLYNLVTEADEQRLQDEYEAFITAEKHGKDF